jgi:hypothetical protein
MCGFQRLFEIARFYSPVTIGCVRGRPTSALTLGAGAGRGYAGFCMSGISSSGVAPSAGPVAHRAGLWRSVFAMVISPASVLTPALAGTSIVRSLGVSGLAFVLLFLQTVRDLDSSGEEAATLLLCGLVLGTLGVAVVATVAWTLAFPFGGRQSLGWTVRAFGLSYSPVLVYSAVGLLVSWAVGWHTAVAFGASGLLWSLRPMMTAIQSTAGGRPWVAAALTTLCGGALLAAWIAVGQAL